MLEQAIMWTPRERAPVCNAGLLHTREAAARRGACDPEVCAARARHYGVGSGDVASAGGSGRPSDGSRAAFSAVALQLWSRRPQDSLGRCERPDGRPAGEQEVLLAGSGRGCVWCRGDAMRLRGGEG